MDRTLAFKYCAYMNVLELSFIRVNDRYLNNTSDIEEFVLNDTEKTIFSLK